MRRERRGAPARYLGNTGEKGRIYSPKITDNANHRQLSWRGDGCRCPSRLRFSVVSRGPDGEISERIIGEILCNSDHSTTAGLDESEELRTFQEIVDAGSHESVNKGMMLRIEFVELVDRELDRFLDDNIS